jgi:Ca2+:H+ antiporter
MTLGGGTVRAVYFPLMGHFRGDDAVVKKILYFMLIFVPVAILAELLHASPVLIFVLSALGIIPLADLIGEGTEELAAHTGPRLGGLLNATLGNAAELIITIFAIREGLLTLVLASITGSIIGNLVLVTGLSVLVGGLRHGHQTFDRRQAGLNATLVVLAVIVLVIPSLFSRAIDPTLNPNLPSERFFSEIVAGVIIVLYGLSLVYSLTAKREEDDILTRESAAQHATRWSVRTALLVLVGATVGVAVLSELLVGAVEPVVTSLGMTEFFLGIIIIPLVGNIAEHLVAVEVAAKNNMELSLAISLGSSLQIALFVAPLLVFISLLFDHALLLVFTDLELIALFSASLVTALISLDGESNWLEGAQLLAVYLIIAVAFFFLPA